MVLKEIYEALFGSTNVKKKKKPEDYFFEMEFKTPEKLKKDYFKGSLDILKKAGTVATILNPPTTALSVLGTLAKGDLVDKLEKLSFNNSFQYYGRYGGPSFSAGKVYEPGQIITTKDIEENPPVDELDNLYLKHDLRYQLASTESDAKKRKDKTREADEIFIKEAEELSRQKDLGVLTKGALKASVLAFKAKLATDIGYNVDQINDPEAVEVSKKYLGIIEKPQVKIPEISNKNIIDSTENNQLNVPTVENLTTEQIIDLIDFLFEDEDE